MARPRKSIAQYTEPHEHPDFLLCMDYLKVVEWDRDDKKVFAEKHSVNQSTLWRWTVKWEADGLLPACRKAMGIEMFEDVTIANRRAVRDWQKAMNEWVNLALHARREDVRLNAILNLYEKIVKPQMDIQDDPGANERTYIDMITQSPESLNPMSVAGNSAAPEAVHFLRPTFESTEESDEDLSEEYDPEVEEDTDHEAL